jgi:hypothetical protein
MDARLAALLWLLLEGGLPVTVAGPKGSGRHALLEALADLRPAGVALPRSRLPTVFEADSLVMLQTLLTGPPHGASDDELRNLGIVLILDHAAGGSARVNAAHYVRPVERDGQGHIQRRPPAVLSTWDPASGGFDDFGWGIVSELAARVAMEAADFADERVRRAAYLEGLAGAGVTGREDVRRALAGHALTSRRRD